jgi:hypothetical protein
MEEAPEENAGTGVIDCSSFVSQKQTIVPAEIQQSALTIQ